MTLLTHLPIRLWRLVRGCWSTSEFDEEDLVRFAQPVVTDEARSGIYALGILSMMLMAGLAVLFSELGYSGGYLYTFGVLGLLALHIALSARMIANSADARVFYLLGIALLALASLAFVLLAHRVSILNTTLFGSVALLFMVVPLVPWGLREALFAIGTVYVIFTGSTLNAETRFTPGTLWTLQFLMLGAAMIALALVWRATQLRKQHLLARFRLTQTNERLATTALQDSLTGAWNRRFLEERYDAIVARYAASGLGYCLALADIDDFKQVNDTHGHMHGDHVLKHVAAALEHALGPNEYVFRIGGDEFAALLQETDARRRLERTRDGLEQRKEDRQDSPPMPSVSIGIARVPAGTQAPLKDLYALADQAMYVAKSAPSHPVVEMSILEKTDGE